MVHAPYNFVPFSDKILEYPGEIPAHNAADSDLRTGEIHVTLTAESPVFVSDGNREDPHFFRGPNGQFLLPGSTIRGMVRQNMQILGFGLVRPGEDMEDKQVFYRKVADARGSTGGELKDYYHKVLDVKAVRSPSGKTYSVPQNVQAGYLRKAGQGYYIQPVTGSFLKVTRDVLKMAGLETRHAESIPVHYTGTDAYVKRIRQADGPVPAGMRAGTLLCPGLAPGGDGKSKPPSHRYVFPPADETADAVHISEADALSYAADWEGRRNALKAYYDPDFWKLPEGPEEKPVFFLQYGGHVYFGMSLFLRIGYQFSLRDGLPQNHKDKGSDPDFLDYPRAILGYAENKRSFRSRVSFGDFPVQGAVEEQPLVTMTLGAPKISYYPGYVAQGKHYNAVDEKDSTKAGFRLRGYKLYWLKETQEAPAGKPKTASKLRPLPAGTTFRGVIRYRNLRPEELGLLLWALRLEKDCFQTLGMGKPYGYGRMRLTIDCLREFDLAALYQPGGLCGDAGKDSTGAVQDYIDAYDALAAKALYIKKPKKKPSVKSRGEIQDFFYLHGSVRASEEETGYMSLSDYQNTRKPLPATEDFRKKEEESSPKAENSGALDGGGAADLYEALLNKYGSKHKKR